MGKTAKADYSSAAAKLLRAVQARQMEKKEKKKEENDGKRYCLLDLPKDCIYRTLIKLDVESLHRAKFVCKSWYKMISNTIFIQDRLRCSEMGLIFLYKSGEKETSSNENVFHVEQHYLSRKTGINWMPRIDQYEAELNLRFMEIKDGKITVRSLKLSTYGQIRAVCNGLVLLESKTKCGPIVVNPVTREYTVLCRGAETPLPRFESYGLAFNHRTEEYKVVHLFRDDLQFFGCEIIMVGSHKWRAVDGPSSGLINQLGKAPIVAIGAFHWMPHIVNSDYIVSMGIDDEKFRKIKLPNTSGRFDDLVDMGGCLSFVNQVSLNQLDVWILEDLHGSKWTLKHKITVKSTICMVPVGYDSRTNELVIKKGPSLGTYDFEQRQIKWIEGCSPYMESYMPHFNSLVSWRNCRGQRLEDV